MIFGYKILFPKYFWKYITNLNDGKRKEYDLKIKQLIYEGECLNGFKNGKVKEYEDCKLIFEGEYKNGKKWTGKVKEHHGCSATITFDGEYLNGKRNGKGKEYEAIYGKLIYDGEFLNGVRNGKGKEYDKNDEHLIFEGEYLPYFTKFNAHQILTS